MACAGSDKRFDLATVELIARIRENRIASRGDCTISYITEQLPGPLFTFARVQAVLSKLKNGMSAAEIAGNYGRGGGRKPSLSSDALGKVIGEVKPTGAISKTHVERSPRGAALAGQQPRGLSKSRVFSP